MTGVRFDPANDVFSVSAQGGVEVEGLRQAVLGRVVLPGVRRLLERMSSVTANKSGV